MSGSNNDLKTHGFDPGSERILESLYEISGSNNELKTHVFEPGSERIL